MTPISPKQLIDLYDAMAIEQRAEFLKLLGERSEAEVPFLISNGLSPAEHKRWGQMLHHCVVRDHLASIVLVAATLVRELPREFVTSDAFIEMLSAAAHTSLAGYTQFITHRVAAETHAKRSRKSDNATVRRNMEIIQLWVKDRTNWTLGKLGKKYGITPQAVSKIVGKDRALWMRLNADLSTE